MTLRNLLALVIAVTLIAATVWYRDNGQTVRRVVSELVGD